VSKIIEMLEAQWRGNKFVCVGLDPDIQKLPKKFNQLDPEDAIADFCMQIVDATQEFVCAYKPNFAFFEQYGPDGLRALRHVVSHIHATAPDAIVILDAKRGDIGSTSSALACAAFDVWGADAITVNPYLGRDAIQPFLDYKDKGVIVLCRTSNKGATEFQNLRVGDQPLFMRVARAVADEWNGHGNCGLVVGATAPQELNEVRQAVGNMPILVPGVGAQGGDLQHVLRAGLTADGGVLINVSRSVLYASNDQDFAQAARKEVERMNVEIKHFLVEVSR